MDSPGPSYSLPVRLSHGATIILLILLSLTGLRLGWLHEDRFSSDLARIIDTITPGGVVFTWHIILGYLLVAAGIWYVTYMLLSNEGKRLFALYRDRQYAFSKKLLYLLTFVVTLTTVFTGVSLYVGLYDGPEGYLFNSFVHRWSFYLLLLFIAKHIFDTVFSSRININSIFFGRTNQQKARHHTLIISLVITAVVGGTFVFLTEKPKKLVSHKQNRQAVIDGIVSDGEWNGADSVVVQTWGGSNFVASAVAVTIKTFHNQQDIYFLVRWSDPTLSFNRYLVKTDSGWIEERSKYKDRFGETIYSEDKLALFFGNNSAGCAATCHVSSPGKMGLHYTDNDTVDVWEWMAVSTNPALEADDRWWGGYESKSSGGRHFDNKASGGYQSNLNTEWKQPYFLPTHLTQRFWIWFGSGKYIPYRSELDTLLVGSRVPSVLVAPTTGDRGDVRARGIWRNGVWTIELARHLSTGSAFDLPFHNNLYFNIAVYDNADLKHTFHLKAIKLEME